MNLLASGTTFAVFVANIVDLINNALYLLIGASVIFFFIGIVRYITKPGDKQRRTAIIWSLVALFVLVSIVGILNIMLATVQ